MIKFPVLFLATLALLLGALLLWKFILSRDAGELPRATLRIGEHSYSVEVATTFTQKAKGLAGRRSLADGEGMLFIFTSKSRLSFTMQGMRFPLDIIWIADGKIVDISKNLQPDTGIVASAYRPATSANMVLELNAGVADANGVKVGDAIVIEYK